MEEFYLWFGKLSLQSTVVAIIIAFSMLIAVLASIEEYLKNKD